MSPEGRKWRFRIAHILDSIERIRSYTRGMSYEAFCDDPMVVDAVIRNFTIIGEAVAQIPGEVQSAHPAVPWTVMRGMRNVLVHEYDRVQTQVVWTTIQQDLPALVPLLHPILEETA